MTSLAVEKLEKVNLTKNFFTEEECFETILRYYLSLETSKVKHNKINKTIRNSKTFLFADPILCEKFGHERMQFQLTEYVKDCFYSWHVDYYETGRYVRRKSYTVLLNDDFTGGEMEFDSSGILNMSIGDSVSFSPHIRHQIRPITSGVRYSLVAWAEGL